MRIIMLMTVLLIGSSFAKVEMSKTDMMAVAVNVEASQIKSFGDIIDGFKEFCLGFGEGVYELARWDIKMVEMCTHSTGDTWTDIKQLVADLAEVFKKFDINSFHKLYTLFSNFITRLSSHFAPCTVFIGFSLHFFDLFRHMTWDDIETRLEYTFLVNAYSMFQNVFGGIVGLVSGNPRNSGQCFGQVIYTLIFH